MSLHELIADYPWLIKRMERLRATAEGREPNFPRRRLRAWLLALCIPRIGVGSGTGASPLIMIAVIGILAAVAVPAYQDFQVRAKVAEGFNSTGQIKQNVIDYAGKSQKWPSKNKDIGLDANMSAPALQSVQVGQNGAITLTFAGPPTQLAGKTTVLRPQVNGDQITWSCGEGSLEAKFLPMKCRSQGEPSADLPSDGPPE
ncbi:MAG: pilin [Candidatus Methylumidiphilus sp.]